MYINLVKIALYHIIVPIISQERVIKSPLQISYPLYMTSVHGSTRHVSNDVNKQTDVIWSHTNYVLLTALLCFHDSIWLRMMSVNCVCDWCECFDYEHWLETICSILVPCYLINHIFFLILNTFPSMYIFVLPLVSVVLTSSRVVANKVKPI